jgi:hypothetical protein
MKSGTISNQGAYDGALIQLATQSSYSQKILEGGMPDNEAIVPKTLREYVADFQQCLENCVAPENYLGENVTDLQQYLENCVIEMGRVLFEVALRERTDFCNEIRFTHRAAIRKFIEIGKAYPDTIKRFELMWFIFHHFAGMQIARPKEPKSFEPKTMKYYDVKKNWRHVKPHLGDKKLNDILVRDFNNYTFGRWGKKFELGQFPFDFENCFWHDNHRGRRPAFWNYVKKGACHYLVNFNLRLAMLTKPKRQWRIITSKEHSSVWDGDETLFDFNFQALGIDPRECFDLAFERQLKPGKYVRVYFAQHYSVKLSGSGKTHQIVNDTCELR